MTNLSGYVYFGFMDWIEKPLQYGGTCVACGSSIQRNSVGWHNPKIRKARCVSCGPELVVSSTPNPVGGSSLLRDFSAKDKNALRGAAGEYELDISLHKHLSDSARILTDRAVPGTSANIDQLVVASSGVWIIDRSNQIRTAHFLWQHSAASIR